jgi:hypothetical protein
VAAIHRTRRGSQDACVSEPADAFANGIQNRDRDGLFAKDCSQMAAVAGQGQRS